MKLQGVHPNVEIYNTLLGLLSRSLSPRSPPFSSSYSRHNDLQRALSILKDMEAAGVSPSVVSYSAVFTLIASHPSQSNFEIAQSLWEKMEKEAVLPDRFCYNCYFNALVSFFSLRTPSFLPLFLLLTPPSHRPPSLNRGRRQSYPVRPRPDEGARRLSRCDHTEHPPPPIPPSSSPPSPHRRSPVHDGGHEGARRCPQCRHLHHLHSGLRLPWPHA